MAVVGDPDVTRSLSFDTRSRDDQTERLAADIARAQIEPRPDYYLAIANRDGLLIGFVRIGFGRDRSGELGYAIRRADWGKGHTSEAAALMIEFGFNTLGLHRIQAACGPERPIPLTSWKNNFACGEQNEHHPDRHGVSAYGCQCRGGYAKCAEVRDAKRSGRRDGGGPGAYVRHSR
ncbi:hypothetical protein Acsp02_38290 [Actinoplanes sp. NBRC 103695]|nr:hypothetical protein Acsp02_38290 [Actinoplanes sp. NBRC 103695]